MSSELNNRLIGALDHKEDDYSILMDEGLEATKLVKKLCYVDKEDKEEIWATRKNNQNLSFNASAL